jgi:hypothetical protein
MTTLDEMVNTLLIAVVDGCMRTDDEPPLTNGAQHVKTAVPITVNDDQGLYVRTADGSEFVLLVRDGEGLAPEPRAERPRLTLVESKP